MHQTKKDSIAPSKTRDTYCQVERWFGMVKQSILQNQQQVGPGAFIRKMYASLQGRYGEHILHYSLPEQLLLKPMLQKDITQSREGWARRGGAKPQTNGSKFYTVPFPKIAEKIDRLHQKSTNVKNSSNKSTSENLQR